MGCGSSRTIENQKHSKVLVIVGPSGVGKGTLINKLKEEFPDKFAFKVSHTTRYKREGEVEGKNYYYVLNEDFEKMLKNNEFLEHNFFANNFYGTSKKEIERIGKLGKICILELDINGANQVFNIKYPANYIAVLPPAMDALKERLMLRGTETEDLIEKRVNSGLKEFEEIQASNIFNKKIVNNDLENAYNEFKHTIEGLYPGLNLIKK